MPGLRFPMFHFSPGSLSRNEEVQYINICTCVCLFFDSGRDGERQKDVTRGSWTNGAYTHTHTHTHTHSLTHTHIFDYTGLTSLIIQGNCLERCYLQIETHCGLPHVAEAWF